jgi:hypothetical protein
MASTHTLPPRKATRPRPRARRRPCTRRRCRLTPTLRRRRRLSSRPSSGSAPAARSARARTGRLGPCSAFASRVRTASSTATALRSARNIRLAGASFPGHCPSCSPKIEVADGWPSSSSACRMRRVKCEYVLPLLATVRALPEPDADGRLIRHFSPGSSVQLTRHQGRLPDQRLTAAPVGPHEPPQLAGHLGQRRL